MTTDQIPSTHARLQLALNSSISDININRRRRVAIEINERDCRIQGKRIVERALNRIAANTRGDCKKRAGLDTAVVVLGEICAGEKTTESRGLRSIDGDSCVDAGAGDVGGDLDDEEQVCGWGLAGCEVGCGESSAEESGGGSDDCGGLHFGYLGDVFRKDSKWRKIDGVSVVERYGKEDDWRQWKGGYECVMMRLVESGFQPSLYIFENV